MRRVPVPGGRVVELQVKGSVIANPDAPFAGDKLVAASDVEVTVSKLLGGCWLNHPRC